MRMKGEQQLFDPGPPRSVDPHPGDLNYEEWSARPDIVHHSTFSRDWSPRDAEVSHYGTLEAAQDNAVRSYGDLQRVAEGGSPAGRPGGVHYDGSEGWSETYAEDVAASTGSGVIHSRRISESGILHDPMSNRYSTRAGDLRASDAQVNVGTTGFEIATGVRYGGEDSDGDSQYEREAGASFGDAAAYSSDPDETWGVLDKHEHVARVIDNLHEGTPVAYENEVEDQGSTSYVAPWSSVTSWEQDVQASPNRPQHVKDAVAAQPRPRTTPFTGESPKLDRNGPGMSSLKSNVLQMSMFAPVTNHPEDADKLVPITDGSARMGEGLSKRTSAFPKQVPNPVHTAMDEGTLGDKR